MINIEATYRLKYTIANGTRQYLDYAVPGVSVISTCKRLITEGVQHSNNSWVSVTLVVWEEIEKTIK